MTKKYFFAKKSLFQEKSSYNPEMSYNVHKIVNFHFYAKPSGACSKKPKDFYNIGQIEEC